MKFQDWEPIYKQILADFEYDRQKDEEANKILGGLLKKKEIIMPSDLAKIIENNYVYVFGYGPCLEEDVSKGTFDGVKIAADGATSILLKYHILPDIIVTDLDGYIPDQIRANKTGANIVIHAHGDNIKALKHWVPKFKDRLFGTTQAEPDEKNNIYNFGGFTDGDRAVFLAAHFQAKAITLVGFDFESVGKCKINSNSKTKLRKLTWASLLIGMIQKPPVTFWGEPLQSGKKEH